MKKKKAGPVKLFISALLLTAMIFAGLWLYGVLAVPQETVQIYFFKDGKKVLVERRIPEKALPLYFAANQLLQGPTAEEKKKGIYTQIPQGTGIRTVVKENGTVKADFTKELEMYGGGTTKVEGIISQIVYTLTSIRGVEKVQIMVGGKKEVVLGSEGYIIDKPLSRADIK